MFAQYSPLFTSGLLSESNTPSTSRRPSIDLRPQKEARGSLPINVTDGFYETETIFSDLAESSPLYLTLMPSRRHVGEGRSFLSLDLAESQSMRSMSLRRKDTVTTRATQFFGRSVPTSPLAMSPTSPYMPSSFAHFGFHSTSAPADVRQFRNSPSPWLRHPVIFLAHSACCDSPPSSSRSELDALDMSLRFHSRFISSSRFAFGTFPTFPVLGPALSGRVLFLPGLLATADSSRYEHVHARIAPGPVTLKATPSSCSTASFRTRQVNRSAALAALEGRTGGRRSRSSVRPRNFMSMSDDEDEGEEVDGQKQLLESSLRKKASSYPLLLRHEERGTLESFLAPLANFIDLGKDEDFPSWRSFVEISS
ncbi:hypothetical protein A0H81_13066 [Grifola frondosa]|uniref:Uncharacterized protein n=1 Tax=Grifola frondosa TaxID=5627 RepID=A0A1C7LQH0_GRIFR|nr:hypothetical protein A0H81_13066 [Grifola frondosa]